MFFDFTAADLSCVPYAPVASTSKKNNQQKVVNSTFLWTACLSGGHCTTCPCTYQPAPLGGYGILFTLLSLPFVLPVLNTYNLMLIFFFTMSDTITLLHPLGCPTSTVS